jgi:hypothetical protein
MRGCIETTPAWSATLSIVYRTCAGNTAQFSPNKRVLGRCGGTDSTWAAGDGTQDMTAAGTAGIPAPGGESATLEVGTLPLASVQAGSPAVGRELRELQIIHQFDCDVRLGSEGWLGAAAREIQQVNRP